MARGLSTMFVAVGLSLLASGCEGKPGPTVVTDDPTDVFTTGLDEDEIAQFRRGDVLLDKVFADADGVGPLYIEGSCRSCHENDARGPGKVARMAIAAADGTTQGDEALLLPYGTVERNRTAAGATQPIAAPANAPGLLLSTRIGPALFARGRIEAIADDDLLAQADTETAGGRVSGRANVMADGSVGRFGTKARISTLDRFVADALRSDVGITSSTFPELPNPDGLTDDDKPGIDVDDATVADMAAYVRTLALPRRTDLPAGGYDVFRTVGCVDCHLDTYVTRADFPVAALAGIPADVFSDLLLHDLGVGDADGITDVQASGREWKTAPLVGLRFSRSYMHDGRAATIDDAIRAHEGDGSEANVAVAAYLALDEEAQGLLLEYLEKL